MGLKEAGFSAKAFKDFTEYIDEIKELLSSDLWENIFLNCSKNEVLIFWLLYRKKEVNMSEIAEYIHVPLNTATGIISRMERTGLVERTRSPQDKRIVLVVFSEKGMAQFKQLISKLMSYGVKILGALSAQEIVLLNKIMAKVREILQKEKKNEGETTGTIRKITIE